ncbi:MAG: tRNA 2-thiouridine(34) synthase MnmA [Candidatus Pacebacteria bacterium]|nr:tRNA 2-thiouridine(34) synthase MnmA [Candidatus Paceibacterota bacterium]MCF7857054.1 tRNA 2-thiouridine(34) synthase MnmA [Candidatus Paceibacterota bacterium]
MQTTSKKEIVFVGLSGGVDSSVAANRLIKSGHTVIGVFIKTWQPDFLECTWEIERLDAMRVAAHLEIPFMTCDAESTYRDDVAQYMIAEYRKGKTPNPDVMCNKFVKFGTFLKFAIEHGATRVATGHYARLEQKNGVSYLYRGVDHSKDQSYFLWSLSQEQLGYMHLPVGDTVKDAVRKEASREKLPTAMKQDSQGICFLGQVDIKEFLSQYIKSEQGSVLNQEGKVIGSHDGAFFYTIGQRHGFFVTTNSHESTPYYVIEKDIQNNTITVSENPKRLSGTMIQLSNVNAIGDPISGECTAQFRYRQKPFKVLYTQHDNDHAIINIIDPHIEFPSLGQSCVLYRGERCLGGGIINDFLC